MPTRVSPAPAFTLPARRLPALLVPVLLLAGCAGAPDADSDPAPPAADAHFPVDVVSCGETVTLDEAPQRAVTLNQGATEVALALGVQDRLAGTAYLDDAVPEQWQEAYDSVPVLSPEYPSREAFLEATPDFAYASYASAFGEEGVGSRAELAEDGTATYVSPFGCGESGGEAETSFEAVWSEVDAVADAFGVPERAEQIRAEQQRSLADLADDAAGEGVRVFWFDSGDDTAFAGAGEGGPQLILDAIGAENVFAGLPGGWADAPWEDVVAADPDVIVLAEANWSTAADKRAFLETDPVLSELRAVRAGAFVTVPFSASTPGVRLVEGAQTVAEQLPDAVG